MVRTTREFSGREGCDPVPGWVTRLSDCGQLGEAVPLAWDAAFRTIHHEPCGVAAEPMRSRIGQSSHQKLGVALLAALKVRLSIPRHEDDHSIFQLSHQQPLTGGVPL